jgi:hypothetical protein
MLQDFLTASREAIIARTRARVAGRSSPRATEDELKNGVPLFLDQFIEALRASRSADETSEAIAKSAAIHGGKLLRMGFTVAQVVYDYGDICQAVTEVAIETGAPITTTEFHTLNRYLDEAIAGAVTEYTNLRERTIVDRETLHIGELAQQMRSLLSATTLSFDLLRRGSVGIGGSTGAALGRGLAGLRSLVDGSFARIRLESGVQHADRVSVSKLLEDIAADASIDANIRGVQLDVASSEPGLEVWADRQLLEAAISKLTQNAVKYNRPTGHASLKSSMAADRVVIEIRDECGGLSPDAAEILFRSFTRTSKGTEPGVGLAVASKCVQAIGGIVRARAAPGIGCVFTVDLPRWVPA